MLTKKRRDVATLSWRLSQSHLKLLRVPVGELGRCALDDEAILSKKPWRPGWRQPKLCLLQNCCACHCVAAGHLPDRDLAASAARGIMIKDYGQPDLKGCRGILDRFGEYDSLFLRRNIYFRFRDYKNVNSVKRVFLLGVVRI